MTYLENKGKIIPSEIGRLKNKAVASFSLSKGNSASVSFRAVATTDSGENQSYYIRWKGNSAKASADLKITDE